MAATVRVEIDRKAVGAFLKSSEMEAAMRSFANPIRNRAGAGFEVRSSVGRSRARAVVIATTMEARRAEATDRTLSKAIGRG